MSKRFRETNRPVPEVEVLDAESTYDGNEY